ncbi:three-Cys-motif partner protein TcmP [Nocardiopsis sp. CC223A]|uniref:three-Cys-motif partner protein TcmP n=1 Tax=Nocardiopsis sp. CC223A TaxID=3044051 RepID=UPI00278C7275|nr:three-Cys-motif partner protein TcmP [Nocardiopsis sp. CC223A]
MSRSEELKEKTIWLSDPHLQVKHLVYRKYMDCWMAKILQKFPEASIVDAFSGPGIYQDGAPGSPILAAKAYLEHSARARFSKLNLICLEQRADRVEELRKQFSKPPSDPRLKVMIQEPGAFAEEQQRLSALARSGDPRRPVLWIIDPFRIRDAPFELVRRCLENRRDEVIVTLFTGFMHRFCEKAGYDETMDRCFGGEHWRAAVAVPGAGARKRALARAYEEGLKRLGLFTGSFGVRVSNTSEVYHLVMATHNEAGLRCWNPVGWKLDGYTGLSASADTAAADTLFADSPVVNALEAALEAHAGTERTWAQLSREAAEHRFVDKHLRQVLDQLAQRGLAIRVEPVTARTPWPEGCRVRFYAPKDVREADTYG